MKNGSFWCTRVTGEPWQRQQPQGFATAADQAADAGRQVSLAMSAGIPVMLAGAGDSQNH